MAGVMPVDRLGSVLGWRVVGWSYDIWVGWLGWVIWVPTWLGWEWVVN